MVSPILLRALSMFPNSVASLFALHTLSVTPAPAVSSMSSLPGVPFGIPKTNLSPFWICTISAVAGEPGCNVLASAWAVLMLCADAAAACADPAAAVADPSASS